MLRIEALAHAYRAQPVLQEISLALPPGCIGCLLGPSGCGKTTLLRLIAGFEQVQQGRILLDGLEVAGPDRHLPPHQRQVGMVFQDFALFPHLSVAENIAFGLHRLPAGERRARVDEMLALVGLGAHAARRPDQLSGGQQQRVALARALAPRPRLLLLDEAFSSLDPELREKLGLEVRDILRQQGMTALVVTHDQHEAFTMADQVAVMQGGRIRQWDTPYGLYHRPADRFVADFIGQGVQLPGRINAESMLEIELGILPVPGRWPAGTPFDVLLRPDDVLHDDASPLRAQVVRRVFRGADFLYTLRLQSGAEVLSLVPSHHDHAPGEAIGIRLVMENVVVFAPDTAK